MIRFISSPEHVVSLSCHTFDEAVQEVLYALFPRKLPSVRWALYDSIHQREMLRSTVLPSGVAFPRVETDLVRKIICGVGIPENATIEANPSGTSIHAVFVTAYPKGQFEKFAPVLANLVHFSQDHDKMAALRRLAGHKEQFETVRDEVFPLGIRGFVHSQLLSPIHRMHHRT